jgi:putative hemolysin
LSDGGISQAGDGLSNQWPDYTRSLEFAVHMICPVAEVNERNHLHRDGVRIEKGRYVVKLAENSDEIESALRLRYEVFHIELAGPAQNVETGAIEFDEFDLASRHLIVVDRASGTTVGTYRLNSIESAKTATGFYSHSEFSIEDLPSTVLSGGVEIGRACIAREHRNTKVLFLLWKGLASFCQAAGKRYFFGCCSIFTRDGSVGEAAYRQLIDAGHFHDTFRVEPRVNGLYKSERGSQLVELPGLFNMYLRLGAKVCGPPTIDEEFGTIDFFVVCDTEQVPEKYRKMFFTRPEN